MADTNAALAQVEKAAAAGQLLPKAAENIRIWLELPHYAEFRPRLLEDIDHGRWDALNEAFRATIPFGTGGRRGRMYPIGTNVINDRTIGESAQGLADYVKDHVTDTPLACAVAYDTRHRSRDFAELCSEIMAAAGFTVYFLDGYRSTPELSFAVRHKNCACGIMVTASHNPPSDNAVKAYWKTGGQLIPPDDKGVIDRAEQVREIRRIPFAEAVESGKVVFCQDEVDAAYIQCVQSLKHDGPRDLKIIYSPLHGVGTSAVCPALQASGFDDVEVYGRHAEPDPDFPNVPGNSSNPENPKVFDEIIDRARQTGAELILATDPDCDRLGVATPKSLEPDSEWATLTGNQLGALLTDYLLGLGRREGSLNSEFYVAKTLVTTELMRRIADSYEVRTAGNLLVGFKWIGAEIDLRGPERFVFGAEESYGFLAGTHARDKDGAVAAMLAAELAAELKSEGTTLYEKLQSLFHRFGCHTEKTVSVQMPGAEGMQRMQAVMQAFRSSPPAKIAGMEVVTIRDYLNQTVAAAGGPPQSLECPQGDMVILDVEQTGNYVAVRPSGTEPKVKFYMFAFDPPEACADLEAAKAAQAERLAAMQRDLSAFAGV
jgi:phosphoglucomutase/phosphomannomutase